MITSRFSRVHFACAILTILTAILSDRLVAAPYFGELFTYRQPDGETFEVRLFGDEFFAYQESTDGYLIVRDPKSGVFCYGKVSPDGSDIISTGVRVGTAKPAGLNPKQRLATDKAMQKSLRNRNLLGVDEKGRRNHGKKLFKGKNGGIINVEVVEAPPQPSAGDQPAPEASAEPPPDSPPVAPAPPPAPTLNQRVGLVLLASFPDRPADITKTVSQVDDYCNAESYTADGNATSVYGYFKMQSNGKLSYKNNVTAWFTAANPRSYYTDNTVAYATRARELIKEGLTVLKAQGFDFTQCDGDNNGKLDGVNCFYAGARTNAWSEGIWPHQSSTSWTGLTGTGLTTTSFDYQITDMPASLPIGTFCHENGHMICDFPDLYSYDGNAANMGAFSLMASSGSTHPRHVDPYLKIHAGWADVVDLTSTSHQLCAVQQDRNFFYRYRNPAKTTEYFIFEVRGNAGYEGVWNGAAATNPANGLVVYHANQTGTNTSSTIFTRANPPTTTLNYATPYELMVVEATPTVLANGDPWYTDPTPSSNDSFSSAGVSSISDSTIPDLKFWASNGRTTASLANIHTISAAGQTMTFIAGAGALPATPTTNVTATAFQPNVDFGENAANQTFSVFNGGGGTLTYTVSDNVTWLACAPATSSTATTEADLITVSYTTSALAVGTHTGTITIDGGAAGIKTIGVTLTVNPRPTLAALPASLAVSGITGTSGPNGTFNISNTGGGTVSYSITKTQAWLTLDRTSGSLATEQDLVTATFNATSLAPGVYTDTITITAAEATNSPLTIPVSYTVGSTDMILTSPNGGETWFINNTKPITWASSLGGTVKIELFKAGVLHTTIAASAPNTGTYNWTLPGTLPLASDYKIKITINPSGASDESFTNFTIAEDLLALALDTPTLSWSTSTPAWFRTTTAANTHDGVDAAESANITHGEATTMETTIVGPGTMTFWWKVSSESGYDFLRFYLNGVEQTGALARISGTVAWVQKTVPIPAGSNVVKWGYDKDGSVDGGTDTAWVDEVVFTPDAQPEIAVEQPVATGLTDGVSTIDFGSVNTGSNTSLTFTIRNVGTADLDGIIPTISGANSTDYTVTTSPAVTVTAGNSTTCVVRFTPGASGVRTALLQIASDDANENPFDISLTGTGVGPGSLAVTPAGNFAPSGTFGGPFTATQVYTLSNPGNTSINWTAAKTQSWATLSAASGTLAAGGNTTVTVSINSGANTLNAGSYSDTVTFTNTTNGSGNTTRGIALTVNPALATVTLGNLAQTYTGSQKTVLVTTNPASLAHSVTYNGSGTAPTNAGTYAVVATITNPNYTGSASNNLVIAKASQTITFNPLSPVLDNAAPFALTASASSGLAVSYSSSNTSVATVSGSTVTVVGIGSTTITASQTGNTNFEAAPSVGQTLTVNRSNPLAVPGGPYKVIVGQSLSLNGSASEASYGNTITSYEWDLNNDSNFADATGATPAAITSGTLVSTWGMTTSGLNTIKLRVTDSAAKTSTITSTVELINALTWDANAATAGQTNGGGAWLNASQWWDGTTNLTWTPGANAGFGGPNTAGGAVTLASPTSVGSITFNTFTGTYTLGTAAQALTINGGVNKTAASGAVTFVSPMVLGAPQTWTNSSTGVLNMSATLDNGGHLLTIDGSGTTSFASSVNNVISGAGGITMNGSGRLQLGSGQAPVHTYSGTTTLNAGVTMIANNNLGTGNLTLNGGAIETYWNTNFIRGLGAGPGEVQIIGGASGFGLNGNTGASVIFGNSAAIEAVWGSAYFNPSTLVLQTPYSQGTSSINFQNKIDLNGANRTIQVSGGVSGTATATISGVIRNSTGTAGIIKTGSGWLILSGANTYNGATTVSEGKVDFGAIALSGFGGGSGRNISVAAGAVVRRNALDNAFLNRLVETTDEITVMTGGTANNLNFSGSAGANLPNAFLGNYASNGAKCEYSGTITPAADNYRLGGKGSAGLLGIVGTNKLTGTQGLIVGTTTSGGRVELAGANDFTGNTVIRTGARLTLGNNLALQNSPLDLGAAGGTFSLSDGLNAGRIAGGVAAPSPTFGGLIGSRNLLSAFSGAAGGNNESVLLATAVTGFTLNPGNGVVCEYSGAIADFATGTTLTKTGLGTQILTGAHTYTGATQINGGALFIDGSLSNVAAALNVASGATLGGIGTIGRNVTIADGGKLEFDISTNAAGHDRLDISAGRDFGFSGTSTLVITSAGGASIGTYTLVTGGNNIMGSAPSTLILPSGWVATASISGNSLLLNVTSISGGSGSLAVAAAGGLSSAGYVGGPFSPGSVVYTLSNPGTVPINWTAGKTAAWLDLSSAGGTLNAGANTTVTVSLNANANALAAGSYGDTVTFTNTTNNIGDTTRAVSLTVNALGTYVVSYNGNGNTGGSAPINQTKTQGVNLTLSGPGTLARTGHSFANWNTLASGSGTNYAAGANYTADAPLSLFAKWTPNTYTVAFDANGGDVPSMTSMPVTYNATYGALATTTRTGYTFNGWFTAPSGGTQVQASTTVTTAGNHTLYAQWTAVTCTVTFNPNSGDAPTPATKLVTYDSAYGALALVTRTGYDFNGWFTAASGGVQVTEDSLVTTTSNHTLYAQWTIKTYTVSYNANGADSGTAPASQTKTHDVDLNLRSNTGNLARAGYTFDGWNTATDGGGTSYAAGVLYATNADLVLYAKWTANTYTVSFDANGGGTPVPTSKSVTFAGTYGVLATTVRSGYNFNGWFTAASGGTLVTSESVVTQAASHTVYAQWTQVLAEMNILRSSAPVDVGGYDPVTGTAAATETKLYYDIVNSGNGSLTHSASVISAAIISGTQNCAASIFTPAVSPVAPFGSTTLTLAVTPAAAGAWSFTVSIDNNDPDENPYHWTVHGVAMSTTTASFVAVADTYIDDQATTANNGALTSISLSNRTSNPSKSVLRGLLRFDTSTIPSVATVQSAGIDFVQNNANSGSVNIVEATGTWSEAANWSDSNTLFGGVSYGAVNTGTTSGVALPTIGLTAAGVSKVQNWVNSPLTNFGFGITTSYNAKGKSLSLCSREHGTAANRPKLTVTYTENPQVAEMYVTRSGVVIADAGTDAVSLSVVGSGSQLAYTIANLGNVDLALTTPVSVTGAANCTVQVNAQPATTVVPSTDTPLVLTVTPTASGPWSVNVSITNNDPNENPYNWTISGNAAVGYAAWVNSTFANGVLGNTGLAVDFDNDGLATGVEWVVGGDPTLASDAVSKKPVFDNTTDANYFIYSYRRSDLANTDPKTSIVVEYGSDLTGWTSAVDPTVNVNNNENIEVMETNDGHGAGVDKVDVKIKRTLAAGGKLFSRLKVVIAP